MKAKKENWSCECVVSLDDLMGKPIDELIEELNGFKEEGFTHCHVDFDALTESLFVKRLETKEECKARLELQKKEAAKAKIAQEKEERKLLAKLKKKYEK